MHQVRHRVQNAEDRMQTLQGQVNGKLPFLGQGRFLEQAQGSLLGKQPWGWEGGMGRLLYSPTWAEVYLHRSTYQSQALSKHNSMGTKAGSREGTGIQPSNHTSSWEPGGKSLKVREMAKSSTYPGQRKGLEEALDQLAPCLCPPGPESYARQWVMDSHYPPCLFLSSLTILGSRFLDQQLEMSLVLLGRGNNLLGL